MLANNMREACLPKLLCEIAAKPANVVTEKEQSLLDLIRYFFFRIHDAFIVIISQYWEPWRID